MNRFCFLYNKTGAKSEEWFETATGEKAYKRTAVQGGHGGRGASGNRGHRQRGRGGRSRPRDPGFIYIITMHGNAHGYNAPPFAKVGCTNNCQRRIQDLQSGNPYRLSCSSNWQVSSKLNAEAAAHTELNLRHLRVNMGGGREWFYYGHLGIDQFTNVVRDKIQPWRTSRDLVESSINPCPYPNQAGAIMATNYGNLNPRLAGVYNQRWRQALQRNVLKIKYNCK